MKFYLDAMASCSYRAMDIINNFKYFDDYSPNLNKFAPRFVGYDSRIECGDNFYEFTYLNQIKNERRSYHLVRRWSGTWNELSINECSKNLPG